MRILKLLLDSRSLLSKTVSIRDPSKFIKTFSQIYAPQSVLFEKLSEVDSQGTNLYKESLKHPDFFHVADLFTVEGLFEANVHLGHKVGSLNDYMRPYLFGSRLGHLVFDLDQTTFLLRDALNFTAHIAFRGGIILFVCRGAQHQLLIEKTAESCQEYAHTREWSDKTFTESTRVFGCVTRLPDLVIFLNTMNVAMDQHIAIRDCAKMLIPTIGIVDSNCDPRLISYPVPGNDDTHSSIKLYCSLFKEAVCRGKQKSKEINQND